MLQRNYIPNVARQTPSALLAKKQDRMVLQLGHIALTQLFMIKEKQTKTHKDKGHKKHW